MNRKVTFITAAVMLAANAGAFAATSDEANELDPSSIQVRLVETKGGTIPGTPVLPPASHNNSGPEVNPTPGPVTPAQPGIDFHDIINDTNQVVGTIDQVVNLAQKIFDIIKANQPVVNISVNYANAIPMGITHWTQLQGWSAPVARTYNLTANSKSGSRVADVTYQVVYTAGGNYKGHGKYLTAVSVQPLNVNVGWGHTFNFSCEVPDSSIANAGTEDDPIASMQLLLKWTDHTVLSEKDGRDVYYVRGDGAMQVLSSSADAQRNIKDIGSLNGLAK